MVGQSLVGPGIGELKEAMKQESTSNKLRQNVARHFVQLTRRQASSVKHQAKIKFLIREQASRNCHNCFL